MSNHRTTLSNSTHTMDMNNNNGNTGQNNLTNGYSSLAHATVPSESKPPITPKNIHNGSNTNTLSSNATNNQHNGITTSGLSNGTCNQTKIVESNGEEEIATTESSRYLRGKLIGSGACKIVYRAFDTEENLDVAWNQVSIGGVSPQQKAKILGEITILEQLKHPNIMDIYDSWETKDGKHLIFITEIMISGTLTDFLKTAKKVSLRSVKKWCRQILQGLVYLHSHNPPIIHRDLKCDNIFMNGNRGEVKIGDLGLSTLMKDKKFAVSVIGTPEFMAPELYEEKYDEHIDIYAFGMCVLEMVTGEYPYSECENAAQIYRKVTSGIKPHALTKLQNQSVKDFILLCLESQENRPSAKALLSHPFLQQNSDDNITFYLGTPGDTEKRYINSSTNSTALNTTPSTNTTINTNVNTPIVTTPIVTTPTTAIVSPHATHTSTSLINNSKNNKTSGNNSTIGNSNTVNSKKTPTNNHQNNYSSSSGNTYSVDHNSNKENEDGRRFLQEENKETDISEKSILNEEIPEPSIDEPNHDSKQMEPKDISKGTILPNKVKKLSSENLNNAPISPRSESETPRIVLQPISEDGTNSEGTVHMKLYLKINDAYKEIMFPFNLLEDTPSDVAGEMVTELDLTEEDCEHIATGIQAALNEANLNDSKLVKTNVLDIDIEAHDGADVDVLQKPNTTEDGTDGQDMKIASSEEYDETIYDDRQFTTTIEKKVMTESGRMMMVVEKQTSTGSPYQSSEQFKQQEEKLEKNHGTNDNSDETNISQKQMDDDSLDQNRQKPQLTVHIPARGDVQQDQKLGSTANAEEPALPSSSKSSKEVMYREWNELVQKQAREEQELKERHLQQRNEFKRKFGLDTTPTGTFTANFPQQAGSNNASHKSLPPLQYISRINTRQSTNQSTYSPNIKSTATSKVNSNKDENLGSRSSSAPSPAKSVHHATAHNHSYSSSEIPSNQLLPGNSLPPSTSSSIILKNTMNNSSSPIIQSAKEKLPSNSQTTSKKSSNSKILPTQKQNNNYTSQKQVTLGDSNKQKLTGNSSNRIANTISQQNGHGTNTSPQDLHEMILKNLNSLSSNVSH